MPAATPRGRSPVTRPFSAVARHENWEALARGEFDVAVVGGGITGCGIALDAASRGLRVALVEKGDFAQGTSSRSSRLVHGGLRYLESFDFRLVFEASAERRRLLRLASHLVQPLPFLFPVWRGARVGYRTLQLGLWLYDALAAFRNIRRHRMLGRRAALALEPGLRGEGLRGGGRFYDASVDDARLTLAVARAAHRAGAILVPRAEAVGFGQAGGRVRAVHVADRLTGRETELRAGVVVNAGGPWSDEVRRLADPGAPPRLRPTKGVHLMLRRERVGNHGALIFPSPLDGRVMFVLPWGAFTYVGTTDTDFSGSPDAVAAAAEDERYLLESVNAVFPGARLAPRDVISTWAGVRPLLAEERTKQASAGATSREHAIWRDPGGLLNVAGGKLTTYRSMAAEGVDAAAKILRAERGVRSGPSRTAEIALPGAPGDVAALRQRLAALAAEAGMTPAAAEHLLRAHGTEAVTLFEEMRREPSLAEPLEPSLPYCWAEVEHALREEMALSVEDILQRRFHLLYEAPDGGAHVSLEVARRMARAPGLEWDDAERARQVEAYRRTIAATRPHA